MSSDNILEMDEGRYSEQIKAMVDVMICLPRSAWGFVLKEVDKKIGRPALQQIIFRAYEAFGSHRIVRPERAVALINPEEEASDLSN